MLGKDWPIGAALLFADPPVFDLGAMLAGLNDGLSRFRLRFHSRAVSEDQAVLSNGIVDVHVRRVPVPLPAQRFTAALGARFARLRPNDYATPLAEHRAAILIDTRVAPDCAQDVPAETRIVICHAAVLAAQGLAWPGLIHWQQSDTLFLPDEIPPVEGIGFPAMLVTRPEIQAAGSDARGRRRFAVHAGLSEHWFGKPVRVAATSHPLAEVLAVIDFCLIRHLSGDDVLAEDGVIPLSERAEVAIRHTGPTPDLPSGSIDLTFRQRGMDRTVPGPMPLSLVPHPAPATPHPINLADHRIARGTRRN